ncbi:MAG: glycosyltransferase family 4 protein, partial [Candidatus Dormibacteraeota bacterium]|nr:glycosyltransferase family 4 protein [Candidatus Dormibacteraeota bacterium]
GVTVHRLPPRRVRPQEAKLLLRSLDVDRALRRLGRLDLVQCCEWEGEASLFSLHPTAPLVTRLATPGYVVDRLNGASPRERRRSLVVDALERWQTRHSSRVICPSLALARTVARDWGLAEGEVTIVPTGIDVEAAARVRPLAPPCGEAPYLFYFGRLEARKGTQDLLDALPCLLDRHRYLHAVFCGDDLGLEGEPFAEYGRRRCGASAHRLHFMGRRPHAEVQGLLRGARVVALPSRWESLANAGLEAMAMGQAIVTTSGSGFAEIIRDGEEGLLVPPGEPGALGTAIDRLLADPALAARLGAGARRRAQAYDLPRMAELLEQVLTEAAGAR